jgi:hypothetical protein
VGTCNFDVAPNPDNTVVTDYSGMYFPTLWATHNITPLH